VTITAFGFVPAAPLLVPDVAGGSAAVDEDLRDACRAITRRLIESAGDTIVVVAAGANGGLRTESATWGFEGFGVARRPADDRPRLPWQLGIGSWLLDDVGWTGSRRYLDATDAAVSELDGPVLVVGDGSACRSEKAPGHLDDRAAEYDATIATAIATGDIDALAGLDLELSAQLMSAGAPAWRSVAESLAGCTIAEAELLVDTAPYGVGYLVGWWRIGTPAANR
jgi:hypothetical protein